MGDLMDLPLTDLGPEPWPRRQSVPPSCAALPPIPEDAAARPPARKSGMPVLLAIVLLACATHSPEGSAATSAAPLGTQQTHERALLDAARYGNAAEVQRLLALGTDIDAKGHHGITPLMNAIATEQDDVVEALIGAGADIDVQDETGHTPLMRATLFGTTRALRLLLEAGADVDAKSFSGDTALTLAISRANYDAAHLLLDHGADVHSRDKDGATPLLVATDMFVHRGAASLTGNRHHEVPTEDVRLVERLIDLGADLDARNDAGWTPLRVAAEAATARVIQVLVERGADRGATDKQGLRAFHWAYRANREGVILELLAPLDRFTPGAHEPGPDAGSYAHGQDSEAQHRIASVGDVAMETYPDLRRKKLEEVAAGLGIAELNVPPDSRLPAINQMPARSVVVHGRLPPELDLELMAIHAPAAEGPDCESSDFLIEPMDLRRDGEHYESTLVVDRFVPGKCAWRFLFGVAYLRLNDAPEILDAAYFALNGEVFDQCDPGMEAPCELFRDDSMPAQAPCRLAEGRLYCRLAAMRLIGFKFMHIVGADTDRFNFDVYLRSIAPSAMAKPEEVRP